MPGQHFRDASRTHARRRYFRTRYAHAREADFCEQYARSREPASVAFISDIARARTRGAANAR